MTRIAFLFLVLSFCGLSCKQNETPKPIEASPSAPESPAPSPVDTAAEAKKEECNKLWAPAAESMNKLIGNPSSMEFKKLMAAIPTAQDSLTRCDNQDVILNALDSRLGMLSNWAGSAFDFTVFLARVQHIGDGAISEGICERGPDVLMKSAKEFLSALQQERSKITDLECLVASSFDMIDMEDKDRFAIYRKRIEKLSQVKDAKLRALRDEAIGFIKQRLK